MQLAFVIPAYNEQALIGKCVESVLAEIKRSGRTGIDVVVVNNNSTDRTAEVAGAYAGVRVVDEKQKGLVSARDGGFRATTAELVANIDADTIVPPGWLDVVFEEFEKDPGLVCLSGPYVYYDLSGWNRFLISMFYGLTKLIYWLNRYVLRVGSVVQGGNFVFRRDAWIKAGGFNREIKFYGEDTDDFRPTACRRGGVPHRAHLYVKLLLGDVCGQARYRRAHGHSSRRLNATGCA